MTDALHYDLDAPMKTYLIEYPYAGATWAFEIKALNVEDARERLKAMPWAKVRGEHVATIPVPGGTFLRRVAAILWGKP